MRILFVFITLVQWSVYTLGGVVSIEPLQTEEEASCTIKTACSSDSQSCEAKPQDCSAETPGCEEKDDDGCCTGIICLTICYPLQTGPVQEALQKPDGIDLLASKNAGYLVWMPNPYPEIFSPPPDQFLPRS